MDAKAIAPYAKKAGFIGNDLAIAIAVALAESSGNPKAHNANTATKDNSYGLWQINMYGALGPARRKTFNLKKNEDLFDPQVNANAAFKIYKGAGGKFTDWTKFRNGDYKKKINEAEIAVRGTDFDNPGTTDFGGGDFKEDPKWYEAAFQGLGGSITNATNTLTESLFKVGLNVGVVIVAIVLLVLGAVILMRSPLTKAAKVAVDVAK